LFKENQSHYFSATPRTCYFVTGFWVNYIHYRRSWGKFWIWFEEDYCSI